MLFNEIMTFIQTWHQAKVEKFEFNVQRLWSIIIIISQFFRFIYAPIKTVYLKWLIANSFKFSTWLALLSWLEKRNKLSLLTLYVSINPLLPSAAYMRRSVKILILI